MISCLYKMKHILSLIAVFASCALLTAKPLWSECPNHELMTHIKTENGIEHYQASYTTEGVKVKVTAYVKGNYLLQMTHYTEGQTEQDAIDGYNDFLQDFSNSGTTKVDGKYWFRSEFKDFIITVYAKGKVLTMTMNYK